jgi:hypothetical protein
MGYIMSHNEIEKAWDKLLELGVSEQTLQIVTSINGYNLETLDDVLYAHAGYRSFDQLDEEEEE